MRSLTPETFSLLISLYSSLLSFFNAKGPSEIPCESEKFGDNNKVDYENDHQLVDCGRCRKVLKDFFFFFFAECFILDFSHTHSSLSIL